MQVTCNRILIIKIYNKILLILASMPLKILKMGGAVEPYLHLQFLFCREKEKVWAIWRVVVPSPQMAINILKTDMRSYSVKVNHIGSAVSKIF